MNPLKSPKTSRCGGVPVVELETQRGPRDASTSGGRTTNYLGVDRMGHLTCSVDGCGKSCHARGYCSTHYRRSRRSNEFGNMALCDFPDCGLPREVAPYCNGHHHQRRSGKELAPLDPARRGGQPIEERFWSKVDKTRSCWVWTRAMTDDGYGEFSLSTSNPCLAHRFSYELANGPAPADVFIDHMCHNRACVRPDHLRLATDSQNGQNRRGPNRNSTTGLRGVSRIKKTGRYVASAKVNGKQHHLGSFATAEEAGEVASTWRRENMPYSTLDLAPVRAIEEAGG